MFGFGRLRRIEQSLHDLHRKATSIMATLDQVLAAVSTEDTAINSLVALVTGLKAQLAEALAGTTLPPAVQAKVDGVFAAVTADVAKVQAALDANVP